MALFLKTCNLQVYHLLVNPILWGIAVVVMLISRLMLLLHENETVVYLYASFHVLGLQPYHRESPRQSGGPQIFVCSGEAPYGGRLS